ncbi:DUF1963 domain-containing protein [Streptomyces canus]|uniref:DUF1963 domain-containing protein n=1 Tax=Streptomyces canus TaxID=58343 RepID=UPI0036E43B23
MSLELSATHVGGRTRFGGNPDMATDEVWPQFPGGPASFVGQVDFTEVPSEVRAEALVPPAGLLRLFIPQQKDESIFWRDAGYVRALFTTNWTTERPLPEGAEPAWRCAHARMRTAWDIPFDGKQADGWPWPEPTAGSYENSLQYQKLRSTAHTEDYLLGWPAHQSLGYDPTPEGMIPLLTLTSRADTDWQWGDADTLMVFITPQELTTGQFDNLGNDIG